MKIKNCRICHSGLYNNYNFREMMFGSGDEFPYAACPYCGCIQILEVPPDIEKYYPPYYYAFNGSIPALKRQPLLKRLFGRFRIRRKYKRSGNTALDYLKPVNAMPGSKILDIGCGKGALICSLYNLGFEKVEGVDKFIPAELNYGFGVKVYKNDLSELNSNYYDLLMMHHVLEHVDDQMGELVQCRRILKKGGALLVRIPLVAAAWQIYGNNWVQLDAPRHFIIHTIKSMMLLAEKTGFSIRHTVFDSTAFQFWGSELYKKGIPLMLPNTHETYPVNREFSAEEILQFEKEAERLNSKQQGDQAVFYLYKN